MQRLILEQSLQLIEINTYSIRKIGTKKGTYKDAYSR